MPTKSKSTYAPRILFDILGFTLILIALSFHTTHERLGPLLSPISVLLGLADLGTLIWMLWYIYQWITEDGERTQQVKINYRKNPIPQYMMDMAQEIENLGFTKLGVVAMKEPKNRYRHWIWHDDTHTVLAYLVENIEKNPFVFFHTQFEDGSLIETNWNFGLEVNRPVALINKVDNSINEAYHLHMHILDEQGAKRGPYKIFDTIDSTHTVPIVQKRNMRQIFASQIQKSGYQFILWSIAIAGMIFYFRHIPIDEPIEIFLVLVMSTCLVIVLRSNFVGKQTFRKTYLEPIYSFFKSL